MPPALVVIDCVPDAALGGTEADKAKVPFVTPLFAAVLWSVTTVPVPPHEAGKLYENTGAPNEMCVLKTHAIANANAARSKKNGRRCLLIRTTRKCLALRTLARRSKSQIPQLVPHCPQLIQCPL